MLLLALLDLVFHLGQVVRCQLAWLLIESSWALLRRIEVDLAFSANDQHAVFLLVGLRRYGFDSLFLRKDLEGLLQLLFSLWVVLHLEGASEVDGLRLRGSDG